jgi:hypothetical protein
MSSDVTRAEPKRDMAVTRLTVTHAESKRNTAVMRLNVTQYRLLERYACTLPRSERDTFRHSVLDRLGSQPSLLAVETAIGAVLERRPAFMLETTKP